MPPFGVASKLGIPCNIIDAKYNLVVHFGILVRERMAGDASFKV